MEMTRSKRKSSSKQLAILTAIAVVAALYYGRALIMPLAIAVLLSFLLAPLVKRAEKLGLGRVPSVVLVSALFFAAILGAGWLVVVQARSVAADLPTYRENIVAKARTIHGSVNSILGTASKTMEDIREEIDGKKGKEPAGDGGESLMSSAQVGAIEDSRTSDAMTGAIKTSRTRIDEPGLDLQMSDSADISPPPQSGGAPDSQDDEAVKVEVVSQSTAFSTLSTALASVAGIAVMAGIAFVFVVFILIWREDLRDRVIRVLGGSRISFSTQAMNELGSSVSRYLLMLFVVNVANGAVIALGLWLIGLPSALLWGLLMAVLRFVPIIGTLTAAALPILLSLAIFDNWTYPLLVIALYITVDALSGNILEPILYGPQVGASSMAVLFAVTFWTWLWGPIGLLLAMPLTVSLVVLGRYVRPLSFLTILLGNQPALPRELRFYQRILSNDTDEAAGIILTALKDGLSREEVYEQVVAPAILLAREDHASGFIDDLQEEHLHDALMIVLQPGGPDKGEVEPEQSGQEPEFDRLRIDCVPANGRLDEALCHMMCHLLSEARLPCRVVSRSVLAGELVEAVRTERINVLCIMGAGAEGERGARYLARRLRSRHSDVPIVVGLWTSDPDAVGKSQWGQRERVETASSFREAREAATRLAATALAGLRVQEESQAEVAHS
jgi:predicted PurR-regulated permease PerM